MRSTWHKKDNMKRDRPSGTHSKNYQLREHT